MAERPDKARHADPNLLGETMADAPALDGGRPAPKSNSKPPKQPAPTPLAPGDPALEDTAADMDSPASDSASPEASAPSTRSRRTIDGEVVLEDVFDRPDTTAADAASLRRFDPEAGKTNVAVKIRAATEAIKNSVATPFGKLIVALVLGLAGLSLTIAAVTIRETPYIIAAVIVAPIGFVLVYWRYQAWLGHKRYMYRLLETLGEDITDFDPRHIYRRAGTKPGKKRR